MRKILGSVGLICLLSGLLVWPAVGFDSTPPTVESCSVTPNALPDSGGSITTSVKVSSTNGLSSEPVGPLYLDGDSSRQLGGLVMSLISGDSKSGIYQQTFTVPANLKPGRYYLTIFPLRDVSQNSSNFYKCPNAYVDYGSFAKPTPTPTPVKSAASSTDELLALRERIDLLTAQVQELTDFKTKAQQDKVRLTKLEAQIKRICGVKKKPLGC